MWVELFDGSFRRLNDFTVLKVAFENGSAKWWISDGVNATRITPGYATESEATTALRTLLENVGLISV
jgi:hypothetical protein